MPTLTALALGRGGGDLSEWNAGIAQNLAKKTRLSATGSFTSLALCCRPELKESAPTWNQSGSSRGCRAQNPSEGKGSWVPAKETGSPAYGAKGIQRQWLRGGETEAGDQVLLQFQGSNCEKTNICSLLLPLKLSWSLAGYA